MGKLFSFFFFFFQGKPEFYTKNLSMAKILDKNSGIPNKKNNFRNLGTLFEIIFFFLNCSSITYKDEHFAQKHNQK
jgi:hypothetical protein